MEQRLCPVPVASRLAAHLETLQAHLAALDEFVQAASTRSLRNLHYEQGNETYVRAVRSLANLGRPDAENALWISETWKTTLHTLRYWPNLMPAPCQGGMMIGVEPHTLSQVSHIIASDHGVLVACIRNWRSYIQDPEAHQFPPTLEQPGPEVA